MAKRTESERPRQTWDMDEKSLGDAINRDSTKIEDLAEKVASLSNAMPTHGTLSQPTVCVPFIIDRIVRKHGERPVMCFQWSTADNVQILRAVVWMHNKNETAYEQKFSYEFKDITDANRAAGGYSGIFGKTLPFNRTFTLTRIVTTDDEGAHRRAPTDDPATNNPPPFGYGIVEFTTGNPGLHGPATHNKLKNGRVKRSKYKSRKAIADGGTRPAGWTVAREGQFAWAWHVNFDRGNNAAGINEKPITTSTYAPAAGDPPSSGAALVYDKANGRFLWRDPTRNITQRIQKGDVSADEINHLLLWGSRNLLVVDPIVADLVISICNVFDSRASGGGLVVVPLASVTIFDFGSDHASSSPAALARPGIPIDPGPPIPGQFLVASQPVQAAIQLPASYTVASTPSPNQDSSGLWISLGLQNVTGNGSFGIDRIRFGLGVGDHVDHPKEAGDPDDDDIDTVDVTGGSPRGGGVGYGQGDTAWAPGTGGIIRPSLD